MASAIEKLQGIDPDALKKIQAEGITTVEDFYEIAKYADSRVELSKKIGVDPFTLEAWSANAGNFILMSSMTW
ncbi:MAG: DUF4332 domain-containing protein [Raoultibacter sp.]